MIDRYVFIKLNDENATPEGRARVMAESLRVLPGLPGVVSVTAGTPADEKSTASWDASLVVRFETVDTIEAYREHPKHRAFVDQFLAPRMEVIKAWNFEVESS